jgi:hypothetical protein
MSRTREHTHSHNELVCVVINPVVELYSMYGMSHFAHRTHLCVFYDLRTNNNLFYSCLVFVTETECVYYALRAVFKYNSSQT